LAHRDFVKTKSNRKGFYQVKKLLIVAMVMCIALMSASAMAQVLEIRLAHEEPGDVATSSVHAASVVFKNIIETQSGGEMVVRIYPASALGNQRERMDQTLGDIIQVNVASIGGIAPFYPLINVVDLPFAFPNHSVFYEVMNGEFGDKLRAELLEKTGFRLLSVNAAGFYVLSNNERPIRTPEDMRGIRFRTMSVPSHIAMMRSLGASATPVPWDELYSALQMGVVGGQHNPIPIMAIGGLQEVQKYATLTNHMVGADWWVTSETFYQNLTDEQREIFNDALYAANLVANGTKLLADATEQGVQFLEEAGIEVYAPSIEELAAFRDIAVPAVMETIEEDLGQEGVDLANALLAAVENAQEKLFSK